MVTPFYRVYKAQEQSIVICLSVGTDIRGQGKSGATGSKIAQNAECYTGQFEMWNSQ